MKDCGVVVAMLPEQELGTSLVDRSSSERGNHPRSPSGPGSQPGPGQARRRPRAAGWGGGPVVVRARGATRKSHELSELHRRRSADAEGVVTDQCSRICPRA